MAVYSVFIDVSPKVRRYKMDTIIVRCRAPRFKPECEVLGRYEQSVENYRRLNSVTYECRVTHYCQQN